MPDFKCLDCGLEFNREDVPWWRRLDRPDNCPECEGDVISNEPERDWDMCGFMKWR